MDWKRTCELIPGGCSTYSKMPCRYVEGVYPTTAMPYPGARICAAGKVYIDYTMGLGAVILGHAYPAVNQRVRAMLDLGGAIALPEEHEGELAAKIHALVPSSETSDMVRFTNTGSEADHAAIKIARAYTGRERILCCGYGGWFSWYTAVSPDNLGCTEDEKRLIQAFTYNDIHSLEVLFEQGEPVAAVIMEPYVFDAPKDGFLQKVRTLCTKYGAVLIFDEVVTGFRTLDWTAQKMFGVLPDLTTLGKCMANGIVPISAICGRKDLMEMTMKGCFESGTFAANPIALAAALATIETIERVGAIPCIWQRGAEFIAAFEQLVAAKSLQGVYIKGYPCRTWFNFPTEVHKSLFWQECLRNGVLFGYAQFISYGHGATEINETVRAMKMGLDKVAAHWDDPEKVLEGKPAQATFRMMVHDAPRPAPGPVAEEVHKYTCLSPKCAKGFSEVFVAEAGRYRGRAACPHCHGTEIVKRKDVAVG